MAASDKALGELHSTVATVLTAAISADEPSAAMIAAAITFLKNNNITASPTDNAELAELNKKLAERRRTGKDTLRQQLQEADQLMSQNYDAVVTGKLQ